MDGALPGLVVIETPRQVWAQEITTAWRTSVEGILHTGRLLIAAKADPKLPHGQFEAMIEHDLPFQPSTARRLMIVARNRLLADRAHGHVLPPSWRTLYELTRLPVEQLDRRLTAGDITPELERHTVIAWRRGAAEANGASTIKPSDNWSFSRVRFPRIDGENGHGYIPGDVYASALWYWSRPGDLVVDPMAGSGQIIEVYENRELWMGAEPWTLDLHCFDLTPRGPHHNRIGQHDLTTGFPLERADYVIMDVPYFGMVSGQYSTSGRDLANLALFEFREAISLVAASCAQAQSEGDLCTVISPNYRDIKTGQITLITEDIRVRFSAAGYCLHDIAYASRRIQQQQSGAMAMLNLAAKAARVMLTDISEIMTFRRREIVP